MTKKIRTNIIYTSVEDGIRNESSMVLISDSPDSSVADIDNAVALLTASNTPASITYIKSIESVEMITKPALWPDVEQVDYATAFAFIQDNKVKITPSKQTWFNADGTAADAYMDVALGDKKIQGFSVIDAVSLLMHNPG